MDAVKYTVMLKEAPVVRKNSFLLGTYANSVAFRTALLQWCYSSRNFGANPTVSAGNGTGADDDNMMQVESLNRGKEKGKGKHQHQKVARANNMSNTDINTCKNCGRTGHWAKDCWRAGGGPYDNPTSNNSYTQIRARTTRKAKAKANKWTLWKRISLLKQLQPCRILHKHRARSELSRAIQSGTERLDHGCDDQFRVFHKETSWCGVFAS